MAGLKTACRGDDPSTGASRRPPSPGKDDFVRRKFVMKKKILGLGLALLMLAGCGKPAVEPTAAPEPTPVVTETASPTPAPSSTRQTVHFSALKGPSGVGAAKLISDSEAETTANHYVVTLAGDNSEVVAGLSNGSIDIAAVASNVAANLYQKTGGGVQVIAVSGLGVLYILENGDSVQSMADLEGQTIYATGQGANPEFVLNYLLSENGVEPENVDIRWKTADEITALMASGEAKLCMLPVPAATGVMMKNPDVREALDLSAEWDELNNGSRLTMTTLVARTEFAQEHPEAVAAFLKEYQSSVEYVNGDPMGAAALVAEYGITPNAKIAEAAIPKCALVCITGVNDIQAAVQGYYEVLWQADPQSIGGGMPDDGFYWTGKE